MFEFRKFLGTSITSPGFSDLRNFCLRSLGATDRGKPVSWPSRSPHLSSISFFEVLYAVYAMPVDFETDLVARLVCAAAKIQQNPSVFERVRQSIILRCSTCIDCYDENFEHRSSFVTFSHNVYHSTCNIFDV